jgi:hypothetical protein
MNVERSRKLFFPSWVLAGILVAALLGSGFVLFLTQTRGGREEVLRVTLSGLAREVGGKLTVDRIEGNLLAGARLYGIRLVDDEGDPFLYADSGYVNYGLRTLAAGDIVLHQVILHAAEVQLRRVPGDTLWNYQRIFAGDTLPPDPDDPSRAILVRSLLLNGARILVHMPADPEADPERVHLEETAWGTMRVMRFDFTRASASDVVIAAEYRGGNFLRLDSVDGTAHIWRQPLRVRHLRGELAIVADTLRFRAPEAVLPRTRLSIRGEIVFGEEGWVTFNAESGRAVLADFRWLRPELPEDGEALVVLTFDSRGAVTRVHVPDIRLRGPGTEIEGSFGLAMGDTVRFFDVDLEAPEVDVPYVERLLPIDVPVRGLRIGALEIRGEGS